MTLQERVLTARAMTLEQRVQAGAKLLDEKSPGWFQRIDLGKLCMSDGTVCVLGQLFAEEASSDSAGRVQLRLRDFGFGKF